MSFNFGSVATFKGEALGDAPAFDQGELVACRAEELVVVRDDADADARIAHARDLGVYSTHVAIVQTARGLVENHGAGAREQTGRDGEPLALPARKGERMPVGQALKGKRGLHLRDSLLVAQATFHAIRAARAGELIVDRAAEQLVSRLLHDQVHAPRAFPCAQRHAVDLDRSRPLLEKAGHAAGERRFPGPVAPDEADHTTRGEVEVEPVQDRRRAAVANAHAAHAHDGFLAGKRAGNSRISRIACGPHRHRRVDFRERGGAQPHAASRFVRQREKFPRRPVARNRAVA